MRGSMRGKPMLNVAKMKATSKLSVVITIWQHVLIDNDCVYSFFIKKRKFVMRTPDSPRKRRLLRDECEITPLSGSIRRSESKDQLLARVEALEAENARLVAEAVQSKANEVMRRERIVYRASLTNDRRVLCAIFSVTCYSRTSTLPRMSSSKTFFARHAKKSTSASCCWRRRSLRNELGTQISTVYAAACLWPPTLLSGCFRFLLFTDIFR